MRKRALSSLSVAILLTICIILSACSIENLDILNSYRIKINAQSSEKDGLFAENISLHPAKGSNNPYLEIVWKNSTDESINHRCKFDFLKKDKGQWVSVKEYKDVYILKNNIIEANNYLILRYDLWDVNLGETGTYKFETTFYQQFGMEFYEYNYSLELDILSIPKTESNLVTVSPHFDVGYTYGEPILKCYATTINQIVSEDGNYLEEGSFINVTCYNGTGRDLHTYAEDYRFFELDAERFSEKEPSDTMKKTTISTDSIETISYNLAGAEPLGENSYGFILYFYTDTGYTYTETINFDIL